MRVVELSKEIDLALRRREELRELSDKFIRDWFELKKRAMLAVEEEKRRVPKSMFASNPKLSAFTEEDRMKFRE